MTISERLGDSIGFYRIGLGMLTGGALALANELKQQHGKSILLDLRLGGIAEEVADAVHGLAQFEIDYLTVDNDVEVLRAGTSAVSGTATRILAAHRDHSNAARVATMADDAFAAGAHGIIVPAISVATVRQRPAANGKLVIANGLDAGEHAAEALRGGADHVVVGRSITEAADPVRAASDLLATLP
ncbi:Orotidine 5'-phosphate decarboxylase [Roseivivax jejudonensis]|uniref:Orotidine 5'-phosphate decarboxylase n=1 Tax=Roseivivax jejudonensis TaxID=1529041 RepID=A0A1X6ZTZ9_9RHOB|nr:Orotidine 5'-phosphate decarboxylase [Roseivivax jejudonensis]